MLGGTSGAAPVWAALLALADSSPACAGTPIGYADPALYGAASSSDGRDFHDVTQGNNDFGVTTQGFSAKRGYDPATGLGTPDATNLVASLCVATIAISEVTAKQTPTDQAGVAAPARLGPSWRALELVREGPTARPQAEPVQRPDHRAPPPLGPLRRSRHGARLTVGDRDHHVHLDDHEGDRMTLMQGTSEGDVDAPLERCWEVVEAIDRSPEWQRGMESVSVLERDAQQRPSICEIVVDAKFTKLKLRVTVAYDPPHRLTFAQLGSGSVARLEGSWELSELGPGGRTRGIRSRSIRARSG